MHTIVHGKYIESEGYWFDVVQVAEKKYLIFNTQRKRQQHIRDGIGYYLPELEFETAEEAKTYLHKLENTNDKQ